MPFEGRQADGLSFYLHPKAYERRKKKMDHEIYEKLYKQYSVEKVVFLSEITSPERKEELEKEKYFAGFTADEWAREYPEIPADKVCCPQSKLFISNLMYYDKDKYICMYLPIYYGKTVMSYNIPQAVKELETAYEEKDYLKLLMPTLSEGSGNITMPLLECMLDGEEPSPALYKAFTQVYPVVDCGIKVVNMKNLEAKLKASKSKEQWAETRKKTSKLPEIVTVYRGMSKYSAPPQKALSWTLSAKTAYFFAGRRGAEGSKLLTATVRKEDIFEMFDGSEQEVIVFPGDIMLQSQEKFITFDEFLTSILSVSYIIEPDISGMRPDMMSIIRMIEDIYEEIPSHSDHTVEHSIRVALLAVCIFIMEECPKWYFDNDDAGIMNQAFWDLVYAAAYHDTGRCDDMEDVGHGLRGYEVYRENFGENIFVKYAIEEHDRTDQDARNKLCSFAEEQRKIAEHILWYLKDADALDRWRFGGNSVDSTDVSMLRTETARLLMPAAAQLVETKVRSK